MHTKKDTGKKDQITKGQKDKRIKGQRDKWTKGLKSMKDIRPF